MKKLYTTPFLRFFVAAMLPMQVTIMALPSPAAAQAAFAVNKADDTSRATPVSYTEPAAISSFTTTNIPPAMVVHLNQMTLAQVINMHEEFQFVTRTADNDEMMMTVKIWFADDRIKGYIFYAPLDRTNKIAEDKSIINMPVQWRCTSNDPSHGTHCSATLADIDANEATYQCSNWHLYLPPFPPPPLPPKAKKEHRKKSKNKPADAESQPAPGVFVKAGY